MGRYIGGGCGRWWGPLRSNLRKTGFQSAVGSILSLVLLWRLGGEEALSSEILVLVSILGGAVGANALMLIWSIVSEPFRIIQEQDETISGLQAIADQGDILSKLHDQRDIGIPLSNIGQSKVHIRSEADWWQEFEQWKADTVNAISLLDRNRARKWAKLGRFTPKRRYPGALNLSHEQHLQMADEWIIRLDAEIDYWEGEISAANE